jgi:hypothetical protein
MNESIRIRLQVDGAAASIDSLSPEGVVLGGESSASPRGLAVSLRPGNQITEFRLRRVRMIQDWAPGAFRFNLSLDGGSLLCRGVDPLSLPFGIYDLTLMISDLVGQAQPLEVEVPDGGPAEVVAKFKTDPRKVVLTTPVAEFDDRIQSVVLDPQSRVDGMAIPDWLAGPARPRRKACLLNILAKARAAKGPAPKSSILDGVRSILFAEVDRIYVAAAADLYSSLRTLAADPAKPFYFEGEPKAVMHKRLLDRIGPDGLKLEPDAAMFHLQSYRQEGKPTLQTVVAIPPGGDAERAYYADMDIDLGNPLQDLDGLFTHFGEILDPGQTDHLALAEKLARGATKDFHYYKVVKGT